MDGLTHTKQLLNLLCIVYMHEVLVNRLIKSVVRLTDPLDMTIAV